MSQTDEALASWTILALAPGAMKEIKARDNELYARLKGKKRGDQIEAYEHEIAGWEFQFSDLGLSFE